MVKYFINVYMFFLFNRQQPTVERIVVTRELPDRELVGRQGRGRGGGGGRGRAYL